MSETIRVEFSRTVDAVDAYPTLSARVDGATLADGEIDVTCERAEEARVVAEVSHAVDEWLRERGLPFMPLLMARHTLLVRPPGD